MKTVISYHSVGVTDPKIGRGLTDPKIGRGYVSSNPPPSLLFEIAFFASYNICKTPKANLIGEGGGLKMKPFPPPLLTFCSFCSTT